ncbi:MAG: UDP-N-acetylmuramate:L-alanyl-gamma-D-glutamyl-meso-diaminopimelate ligase [Francisellaceae bacterium]
MKHIHILGICGTFMGSIAVLAKAKGYRVSGCDTHIYPPMSDFLDQQGIDIIEGFDSDQLTPVPDLIIVGNTMKRGMPVVEAMLNRKLNYASAPQWLYETILKHKTVIAIAGTHGKTTTSCLVAHMLDKAGFNPGFLIGGVSEDFGVSARLTASDYFVIEADEYDTAFFDKRSKFIHYHPDILVMNNLEFDHADIFDSIEDIYRQFHHLIRAMPEVATIVHPKSDKHIEKVLQRGVWSKQMALGVNDLFVEKLANDWHCFAIYDSDTIIDVNWSLIGQHNADNALAAYAVGKLTGVDVESFTSALYDFKGARRRLECIYRDERLCIYDDFAHHPTAITRTLQAIRASLDEQTQLIVLIDPRSHTMKMGTHKEEVCLALNLADEIWFYQHEDLSWQPDLTLVTTSLRQFDNIADMVEAFSEYYKDQTGLSCCMVLMSNAAFGDIRQKMLKILNA